jgi:hypothetical protein
LKERRQTDKIFLHVPLGRDSQDGRRVAVTEGGTVQGFCKDEPKRRSERLGGRRRESSTPRPTASNGIRESPSIVGLSAKRPTPLPVYRPIAQACKSPRLLLHLEGGSYLRSPPTPLLHHATPRTKHPRSDSFSPFSLTSFIFESKGKKFY